MLRRTTYIRSLFILLVAGVLMQCHQQEPVLAPNIASLVGTWRLVEPASTYDVMLTIELDTKNPPHDITPFLVNGKSSVNEYTIRLFAAVDGMMSASNLSQTKRAGTPEAITFEEQYLANLKAVVRFEQPAPNQLRLLHGGTQPHLLVYEKFN